MINEKIKFNGGLQLMVWGMISRKGGVAFTIVEGSMNSDLYIEEILKKYVITNKMIKKKKVYF